MDYRLEHERKGGIQNDSRFCPEQLKEGNIVYEIRRGSMRGNKGFRFRCVKFEMPIRNPSGNVKEAVDI